MAESQQDSLGQLISRARQRVAQEIGAEAEDLQKLEQDLNELRKRHAQLGKCVHEQLEGLSKAKSGGPAGIAEPPMDIVLAGVRNLITATLPEQVLDVLTEEAAQTGVRAAVFEVRGKAAWGASARGFGSQLTSKFFRTVAVPLNYDGPFRQVYETGGHADASAELLKKNQNVLERLKPADGEPILLLPVRSAGAVSAILYAGPGDGRRVLPVNALKILAEFAGAQLDRLMALGGGLSSGLGAAETEPAGVTGEGEGEWEPTARTWGGRASTSAAEAWRVEENEASPVLSFDISRFSEDDQKVHKDAKRFARLLVSEIELYNKAKVADGRKNKDLYRRLKADIDRSRQTYEKRFGRTVAKQHDYFHNELVKTLANSDPSNLGSDYPGPSA